ncbi:hypothetical protein, partial [Microbacterium sp. A93]|uniref:hypothetical protein n=1 Tax=Microbacterium sp. A93 TaxID=3450716 RepID=UPI003F44391D
GLTQQRGRSDPDRSTTGYLRPCYRIATHPLPKEPSIQIEADPPVWYEEFALHHPEMGARRAAAADVLVWRAVSGQDDADTPLGKAPTEKDNTAHYHHAAHAALNPTAENRTGGRDARHEALVSGLSDNWINLESPQSDHGVADEHIAHHVPAMNRQLRAWDR